MKKTVPFDRTYLYATIETGNAAPDDRTEVTYIEPDNGGAVLVQIRSGGIRIFADVATARSLAAKIMQVTNDGDLLWDTEPMTGEEVDRWTEDIRAGAIGGDPA